MKFYGASNISFSLMIMNFVLKPSLEHMTLVKIVVSLWNQNDVRALMLKFRFQLFSSITDEKWKKIEERVTEKVPPLSLPQLLKEKLLGFIKPIGSQIFRWIKFHSRYFGLCVDLPSELFWTPQGTIDRKKTAEVIIKDENLYNMSTRYKLACICCLEDYIIELWNNMSKDLKQSFFCEDFANWDQKWLVYLWTREMKSRELGNADTSYKNIVFTCACRVNKIAVECFLQKLTPREREESLVETAKYAQKADVLSFLLSRMDEEQQMEVFKNDPYEVLKSFLEWPFQSFFIGIADCMWDFLSKDNFDTVSRNIIDKVRDGYKDWNYQNLFREFWQKSPNALKSFIINDIYKSRLLPYLFHIKNQENIRLILKDATFAAKEKLIYSDEIIKCCQECIRDNEWDFLEFSIRECLPSKDEMLKFKEEFEKHMISNYYKKHFARNKQKWDQIFSFSDYSICNYEKKSLNESKSGSSK